MEEIDARERLLKAVKLNLEAALVNLAKPTKHPLEEAASEIGVRQVYQEIKRNTG